MQLQGMIDAFLREVCAGKANETPVAYKSKLRHLEKYLGADCEQVNQDQIDRFRAYLLGRTTKQRGRKEVKGKLSKFTIRSVLATTRHFLRWAGERGLVPQGIRLPNIREPVPDPKPIEAETVTRLLHAASCLSHEWEQARDTAILYVLRDTGGRVGAVSRLDLESLDLERGYATVMDKGDQPGWLWFNPPTVAAIRAWLEVRPVLEPKDYYLFTGSKGYGISRQGIYRMIARLAKIAGVTGRYNPHAFRHAFARDSLLAGADLGQISQMMHHKSIIVTVKYYARWKQLELKRFHHRYSPGRLLPKVRGSAKP